jgi:PhoPQ-activated pathogenicity-related protein
MYRIPFSAPAIIALFLLLSCNSANKEVNSSNALQSYLKQKDKSFKWELKESYEQEGLKVSELLITSQLWRGIEWKHQLTILIPEGSEAATCLLFITGGSNRDGEPNWKGRDDALLKMMTDVSLKTRAPTAILRQVPNQPLFGDLTEDALISYTLHNFKSDRDFTWPLLFPMVKSAVRAMDAIEDFSSSSSSAKIDRFVVTGASKRGWTTWLTASQEKRVIAIAPMVIDVLNMPVNVGYQKEVWGDYSVEIQDYVKLGIAQELSTPEGKELTDMIDPYSYRNLLTVPKLIIIGTNDPYWPVDAVKHYFHEIPGENFIHYEPNVGHDLGDGSGAINALGAFYHTVLTKSIHPQCKWVASFDDDNTDLLVSAAPELIKANLWICNSPDRDFRNDEFTSAPISFDNAGELKVNVDHPGRGFRAFYVELVYPGPAGSSYSKSTRMFVADSIKLFLD